MNLAWAMVRHRFAGFAGTFVALTLGVAVIAGSLTLWASARPRVPDRLAAAPVLVRSPLVGQVDAAPFASYRPWSAAELATLTGRLSAVPGVLAAVPDRTFYVQRLAGGQATGDRTESLHSGHGWSSAALGRYRMVDGHAPDTPGTVVVDRRLGLRPGATLTVLTAEGPATWQVSGTATFGGSRAPADRTGFYVDDSTAARLAGGVRVIGLRLTAGTSAASVAARLRAEPLGTALTGAARAEAEPEADARTRWIGAQLIIAMVLVGGFTGVFVVASTCAFAVMQRRREIGLLRAVGATPGQVRRLVLAEVALVALGAGLLGAGLGAAWAPLLGPPMTRLGLEPAGFTVRLVPWALAVSIVVGLVVALLGAWSAGRRAGRVPALEALRAAAVERRPMTVPRWLGGAGCLAVGTALCAAATGAALRSKPTLVLCGAMLLLVAAALLSPVLVVPLVRLVTWPLRRTATGQLVREGTLVAVRRVASTAAPVLVAVGFAVLLEGAVATFDRASGLDEARDVPAAAVVAPDATPGLSAAAVAGVPGRSTLPTEVYLSPAGPDTPGGAAGGSSGRDAPGRAAGGSSGPDRAERAADAVGDPTVNGVVAVPRAGLTAGSTIRVRFADGAVETLPVVAVREQPTPVTLPRDLVRRHDPGALADVVFLTGPVTAPVPGGRVLTAQAYADAQVAEEGDLVALFLRILLAIGVGYTALAVANTLLMATFGRRVELAALRFAGATTGQAVWVAVVDALLSVLTGTLLGAAVAIVALDAMRDALADAAGAPIALVVPWGSLATVAALCATLALLGTIPPILRMARRRYAT